MANTDNLGIWMDHSSANLIDLNFEKNSQTISSKFSDSTKEEALRRCENRMHNKQKQMHQAYYKEIAGQILNYQHVVIFGPTNAKTELNNYLNADLHFKDIQIDIAPADKMTDNQKAAFVKKHFV